MVCAIRIIAIAAFLMVGAAAAQTAAKNEVVKACKIKGEKCISHWLAHNPKYVCTSYCRPELVCG